MVDLWLGCAERGQQQYIVAHPRDALSQAKGLNYSGRDPRLSEAGNQVWKRIGLLLDVLGRMEVWLAHHGQAGLDNLRTARCALNGPVRQVLDNELIDQRQLPVQAIYG